MITNQKGASLIVEKRKGAYCSIYHQTHFLNTEIATAIPSLFFSFLIDLRDVETGTKTDLDKSSLIQLFESHLHGHDNPGQELKRSILPTTNTQYRRGI